MTEQDLKLVVLFSHVDGPGKLLPLGFVVNLLHGNVPFLNPAEERRRGREKEERRRGDEEKRKRGGEEEGRTEDWFTWWDGRKEGGVTRGGVKILSIAHYLFCSQHLQQQ